ncbi:MAG: TIM barrel protein [Anaerolineaceae bacterium]|nr:TIM barrel protein [Anaerolineaceae bacterium]MCB9101438.1 TIM barrel protein [Anaerolineales bacterium]
MYQLSVCADTVFLDVPFEERVKKITDAGFRVEFAGWKGRNMEIFHEYPNVRLGSIVATGAGSILHPEEVDALVESVAESVKTANYIGSKELILLAGVLGPKGEIIHRTHPDEITRWITAYKALCRVAEIAEAHNVTLCLEHLNTVIDHVGYGIGRVEQAVQLVREVNSPHIKIVLDIYHAQVEQGNVIELIQNYIDDVGYVHVADVPGRHEPGTGEIHYRHVAQALHEAGYEGIVGLEAFPAGDPYKALDSFREIFTLSE